MKFKTPTRAACALLLSMVALVATTIFAQKLSNERSSDEMTTRMVCDMIGRYHIHQGKIDDAISSKLLDRYVSLLDSEKIYFLQSDIDQFNKYRDRLDDLVNAGDVDFAYDAFQLYYDRLKERVLLAEESLIDAEYDFTVDEKMAIDSDNLNWAETDAEIQDRMRKRIKFQLLSLKLDDVPLDKARERLHRRYHRIQSIAKQTSKPEKLELYLSALTHCFDPHSSYMSPQTLEEFRIQMRLSLDGIGAALQMEDGYTVVKKIVSGGAAEKDGRLKVGDKITGVGQEEGEIVDVVEMKLGHVVQRIRGKRGTIVRLQVKTADAKNAVYELTRQKVELKAAAVKGDIIKTESRFGGAPVRIGVISIPSFYRDFRAEQRGVKNFKSAARDVKEVLLDFRDQSGVDLVVVDLRSNGGGALNEAIEVSGLFIDEGPIVQIKQRNGRIKILDDEISGVLYSGPLVVVSNRWSASASEIFAGAIQDYGRGIVVGDLKSHGKGTVQNVMPVGSRIFSIFDRKDRGALKLTIQQFYRVNGDSTQNRGVISDVVLPSVSDHFDLGESFLKNALPFDRVDAVDHDAVDMIRPEIIETLKKSSARRIKVSADFQKVLKKIAENEKEKGSKTVSLNEEVLRKKRLRNADDKKDKKDKDETEGPAKAPIFPDNAYNNEILKIGIDYLESLDLLRTAGK